MRKYKIFVAGLAVIGFLSLGGWYLHRTNIPVLEPRGPIAAQERGLIFFTLALSLVVVIPVFTLLFLIVWRYREGGGGKYSPNLDGNRLIETIWWLIPSLIILVIGVVIWNSSHTLDPYRPIKSSNPQMVIQVVALDWKWLFIYPQQNIASVNYVNFPVNTPVDFQITSDAPMNSFWIPQLGGQIYAMPGMDTSLNLLASSGGNFYGSSANISGNGFAGMHFIAHAGSSSSFASWVDSVKHSTSELSQNAYAQLSEASTNNPVAYYASAAPNLYYSIIDKYIMPLQSSLSSPAQASGASQASMPGMYMP